MRAKNLLALSALVLGLSVPAAAQRHVSIRTGLSVGARFGNVSVHLGRDRYGSHAGFGYVSSRRHSSSRVWIPGCYRTAYERVWIPTAKKKTWIEPIYETRYDECGRAYQVLVREGCWRWIEVPGHYEDRPVKRYVPGRWEYAYRR